MGDLTANTIGRKIRVKNRLKRIFELAITFKFKVHQKVYQDIFKDFRHHISGFIAFAGWSFLFYQKPLGTKHHHPKSDFICLQKNRNPGQYRKTLYHFRR
jgi:hypothetical protein